MAWIESHEDIGLHPKTINLSVALKIDIPCAVGILHLLWHFTLKFAWQDGNLEKFSPQVIARSIQWSGDADQLIKALQESGWLDGMVVHDWFDYAGKMVNDRRYNMERRKTSSNAVNLRKSSVNLRKSPATLPNLTIPNHTLPNLNNNMARKFKKPTPAEVAEYATSISFQLDGGQFCDFYESKGWKIGNAPMKDWKAAVRTWKINQGRFQNGRNNGEATPLPGKYAHLSE